MFGYCPLSSIWLSKEVDVVLLIGNSFLYNCYGAAGFFPIRTWILFVNEFGYEILDLRLKLRN